MNLWQQFIGGPQTTTTSTNTDPSKGSNAYVWAGVALLGIALIVGVIWANGGFKKKVSA